jgi:hypothetical protein
LTLDGIGRVVYAVRGAVSGVTFFDYRGALPDTGASAITRLGEKPVAARDLLISRLADRSAAPEASPAPALAMNHR